MSRYGFVTVVVDGQDVPALLGEDRVVALAALGGAAGTVDTPHSVRELLADWERWCDLADGTDPASWPDGWSLEEVRLRPPITDPPTVYCAGANYYDHLAEMGGDPATASRSAPFHFLAAPSSLCGHGEEVVRPADCERLDWEVELAVVIGRRAVDVDEERALHVVAGYTVANDVSVREHVVDPHPSLGIDWLRHKSHASHLPLGPAIVPARHVTDPMALALSLSVNGAIRQSSRTDRMISSVTDQIAALSRIAPLLPGDVILTGTPAGTATAHDRYLRGGDVMRAEVEGIGVLENPVVEAVE